RTCVPVPLACPNSPSWTPLALCHPPAARQVVKLAIGTGNPGGSAVSRDESGGETPASPLKPARSAGSIVPTVPALAARGADATVVGAEAALAGAGLSKERASAVPETATFRASWCFETGAFGASGASPFPFPTVEGAGFGVGP